MEVTQEVWKVRLGALMRAQGSYKEEFEGLHKTLNDMTVNEKDSLEKTLVSIYKKFGEQSLTEFWERVLGLGFYNEAERLIDFAQEFYKETAQSIIDSRAKITEYQRKEALAMQRMLF